jgi:diguanylate cyclase (GGDEF)-like protein/PAS domain S-box-containing protein
VRLNDAAMTSAPTIRVLFTEDVAADAELELRELKRAGLRFTHRIVQSEESFTEALREFAPDVILSDFSMPGFDGMSALALARDLSPDTPFVFVSGTIGEEYAIRALKSGATDYVLKTNLVRLPAAVERALADARERRERRRAEAELEIARERITSIFGAIPDMLWSVDASTGRIIYVSPAAQEIFGYSPDEFIDDETIRLKVVHPDDQPKMLAAWQAMKTGAPFDIEYRVQRADGTRRWINNRGRAVRDRSGAIERFDGLVRDITAEVAQRTRLARLRRIREFIGELNAAIVRTRDQRVLFEAFCRIAVDAGGFHAARLLYLDRDGKLQWGGSTNDDRALLEPVVEDYNASAQSARSLVAAALRNGAAAVSNDAGGDKRLLLRDRYAHEGVNSLACLPYVVEGKTAGVVVLYAKERGFFDDEEMRLLGDVTSNLSFALELLEKQDRISYLALYDTLTGLPNRHLFHERLGQALQMAGAAQQKFALAIIDLERFKAINDTLGHAIGDALLKAVAQRLREATGSDINRIARLGPDLFALMFQNFGDAEEVARQLEDAASKYLGVPYHVDGREISVAAKAGIAVYPDDGRDADALLGNAEAALQRAKETGERYLFYAPTINARVSEQVELEHRLRKAVERGELFLHFQPKVDLVSRRIVGLEALMRWQPPEGGLVSPAKFVPVLEQTGLILEAGRQAIARASATYRAWTARGLNPPRIAVNVSAMQLRRRGFAADVHDALADAGGDGGGIDLEITESLLMTEIDESIRKLREVREMGITIALDDFGTGYSSLAYLSKLPIDSLKIDRGFVRGMTENADDTSIISIIISLAQALRLKVVAEGVESEQQAQLLRLLRCDQAQGYLFSPPVAAEKIETMLRAA